MNTSEDEIDKAFEREDYEFAFAELLRRSKSSSQSPVDMWNLGLLYENGWGTKKDAKKGLHWYRQAAEGQNAPAFAKVGNAYASGSGVRKNLDKAIEWYIRGVELGDPDCWNNLGATYATLGDWASAIYFYEQAAELKYPLAFINLGECYRDGNGVIIDRYLAYVYYSAAESIDPAGFDEKDELIKLRSELDSPQIEEAKSAVKKLLGS